MRSLKPVVWLRMEGKAGDRTLHDEMGNAAGKVHWDGAGNPFVEGRIGKGLWLRGPQLKDYAILPDYPKAKHGKLSVSAWVLADSRAELGHDRLQLGPRPIPFRIDSARPKRRAIPQHRPEHRRISSRWTAGHAVREGPLHPFPLNEWQHVAFVTDGATLRLYRQGREVGSTKCIGLKFPVTERALCIGTKNDNADDHPHGLPFAYWSGKIDEVAVFNDALTATGQKTGGRPSRRD